MHQKYLLAIAIAFVLLASNGVSQDSALDNTSSLNARLVTLDKLLESARVEHNIPGFAIAIVKDDKVVFSKGYGYSNIATQQPVTTKTLFGIGSTTKAFTSTLVGMLVDEGKMSWDDPVSKFLPEFEMRVETGDDQIRIRDLLCHRTGFTRMGILWAGGSLTREEVIHQAAQAEAYAGFREKFLYNNVMYMTAGICAGRAIQSDWDTLVAGRIFGPLGMKDSTTFYRDAQRNPNLSRGYLYDAGQKDMIRLPMRNTDTIGPSGSICSNVEDMARWVRFQLGRGQFEGRELLGAKNHAEAWKSQIKMTPNVSYGLGWMLHQWNDMSVVEHGGSVDGFGAQVTLLPKMNTGYVMLTNVSSTPLQQGSIKLVFDSLFGEQESSGEADIVNMEGLAGRYVANFGKFDNAIVKVTEVNGRLKIQLPGRPVVGLKSPDENGKWYFDEQREIAISFGGVKNEMARSITLYRKGMAPEFLREGLASDLDSPLSVTTPVLGTYRHSTKGLEIEMVVRNGRLVALIQNSVFVLRSPDSEGLWAMRANPNRLKMRFNKTESGVVESLSVFEGAKPEMRLERDRQAESERQSELKNVLEKIRTGRGEFDRKNFVGVQMKGTSNFVHQGARGTIDVTFANEGQFISRQDFGGLATIVSAYDGSKGVTYTNVGRFKELAGKNLKLLELSHPTWFLSGEQQAYQSVTITGRGEIAGQETVEISLSGSAVSNRTLHVSVSSGLVLKEDTVWFADNVGQVPVSIHYSDFRKVNGLLLPFRSVTSNPLIGDLDVQFDSAQLLTSLPVNAFVVERPRSHESK